MDLCFGRCYEVRNSIASLRFTRLRHRCDEGSLSGADSQSLRDDSDGPFEPQQTDFVINLRVNETAHFIASCSDKVVTDFLHQDSEMAFHLVQTPIEFLVETFFETLD